VTDELGNVLTATDRNGAVVRTRYDSLNRVIQAEYLSDATTQAAQYNQYGELDLISNEAVTYSYAYDNQQRMTRKTDSRNGLRLDWGYNEIGRVVSKFDYQNVATKFTYDNTGRLIAMANKDYVQASYHYDAAGRLLSRILSNGAATLYNYDKDGFLTKITQRSSSGDIIDERSYTQDSVGNITQVAITGGDTTDYLYDPAYRLTQVNASDVTNSQTFSYDGVGNRLSKTHNGVINNYTYSIGNRLDALRHGTALVFSYDYDDNGSRINKRNSAGAVVESYQYNQKRLITQMNSAGSVTDFAYDPNLYRIQKSSSAGTNHYLLEAEHLESVYDENNQLKSSYLRGVVVDEIINGFERDANGNMLNRTFHHDQVNSVVALSDHNGATAQARTYTPFGLDLGSSGESTNSLAYTGREQDNEGGLYYYRARYYDPEVGRFISEDPLGFEAGINFYTYVENAPIHTRDPSGLLSEVIVFEGVGSGASSQGHVAANINGTIYSWGPNGMTVVTMSEYMDANNFRDGVGLTLDLTWLEETMLRFDLSNFEASNLYSVLSCNCTDPIESSLESLGFDLGINITPNSLANSLDSIGVVIDTTLYPASVASDGYTAPYATDLPELGFLSNSPGSSASGGFVLYPNQLNLNNMTRVYEK